MKKFLSPAESADLDQQISNAEKLTNAQIVVAAVGRSDTYAELPWKAFALGASAAGLLVFLINFFQKMPEPAFAVLLSAVIILGAGALLALLTVICPPFARLFLSENRAETEVKQYAESLFLSREMFNTQSRCGLLIFTSVFEKYAAIIPDKGIAGRMTEEEIQNISEQISGHLKRRKIYNAMTAGLDEIIRILEKSANREGSGKDELSNEIIEEKGV